jgi:putative ABC transport system permease protein
MGIPILRGRDFNESEEQLNNLPPVVVIDKNLAEILWPNEDPLGKRITLGRGEPGSPPRQWQVIGIAGSVIDSYFSSNNPKQIYIPYAAEPKRLMNLHIEFSRQDREFITAAIRQVRGEISTVEPNLPVLDLKSLDQFKDDSAELWLIRTGSRVFLILGISALMLAAVGVYGVRLYSVSRRTHEIGIRMALGSTVKQVVRLILVEGLKLAGLGVAVGLLLSFGVSRLLASLLYRVSPSDPLVFISASILLTAVTLLSCYIPARRAARVDPNTALRCD